mgnify:CR=1 FL=1
MLLQAADLFLQNNAAAFFPVPTDHVLKEFYPKHNGEQLIHVIGAALLYFTIRKIVRDYREKDYAIHRTELLFILTPGLTGLMVCILLRVP